MLRSQYLFILKSTNDLKYNRLTAEAAGYVPIQPRWTLALRGDYAWNDFPVAAVGTIRVRR
ncbi:MAG: hypothetical protein IPP40_15925 [bacterium]|nr:hypothetical protein [bacterium]